jgi:hypothetical protein
LTLDSDFWQDKNYPLQITRGVIFLDIPPDQVGRAVDGLARFYALFGKYYPLNWWGGTKARVYEHGFVLRIHTWERRVSGEEYRLHRSGHLMTRTIR